MQLGTKQRRGAAQEVQKRKQKLKEQPLEYQLALTLILQLTSCDLFITFYYFYPQVAKTWFEFPKKILSNEKNLRITLTFYRSLISYDYFETSLFH